MVRRLARQLEDFIVSHPIKGSLIIQFLCLATALAVKPALWDIFFAQSMTFFDQDIYLKIANEGYQLPKEPAFYPLWPTILSWFSELGVPIQIRISQLISYTSFLGSIVVFHKLLSSMVSPKISSWMTLIFAANPNSIFFVTGYPEALFSLLSLAFLWSCKRYFEQTYRSSLWLIVMFTTMSLMSSLRPIVAQVIPAIGIAGFLSLKNFSYPRRKIYTVLALVTLAVIIGYLPFGMLCLHKFGSFFQPFLAQSYWDRKLGLYWSLILDPKSVSGSHNILFWDLQAFYGPVFITGFCVILRFRSKLNGLHGLLGLFCSLFAAAHSGIAFLTYPIFMSLARHVFSNPMIYLGVAMVLHASPPTKKIDSSMKWYVLLSVVFLVNYWLRIARSGWIG